MKIVTLLLFFVLFNVAAQTNEIPNADFENWSGNSPAGWWTSSNQFYTNVTQSSDAQSGSYSVRGEVVEFSGTPAFPALYSGALSAGYFPISQSYTTLTGYYQYYPSTSGLEIGPYVVVNFLDDQNNFIAQGVLLLVSETVSTWQGFTVQMDYSSGTGGTPTQASVQVSVGGEGNGGDVRDAIGSYFLVDNFVFEGGTTGITKEGDNIISEFSLEQNYPNPFNPTTSIKFNLPEESFVNLKLYNIQGKEIATLVNEELSAGTYNTDWKASEMPSGVYVYVFRTKDIVLSRKMILLK